jgi:MFS family permease
LLIFVHEKRKNFSPGSSSRSGLSLNGLTAGFDIRFKVFLAVMAIFTLGNSSDFFVLLRAQDLGVSLVQVASMLVLLNVIEAAVSLPAALLSDRLGRKRVITLGWLIYVLTYLGFALAASPQQIWLLFAGYGIYYGIVEGVALAFIADLVPDEKRGTAYGLYHGVVGITLLPASLLAGWLWQAFSPAAPFYLGAALAFLAMLGMRNL